MKTVALIYALWEKNLAVLQHYLQGKKRTVLVPEYFATEAVRKVVEASGCELRPFVIGGASSRDALVSPLLKALQAESVDSADESTGHSVAVMNLLASEIREELPIAHGLFSTLEALAEEHDIEITLINEDALRDGKVLALWSRHRETPVLQLAHGTGIGRNYIGEVNSSDFIAVSSQRSAEYFIDQGIAPQQIHVVGNPCWDILPAMKMSRHAIRQRLADAYDLPLDGFWLVWGSTWNAQLSALDNRDYIEQMLQACQSIQALSQQGLSQVRLIYKDRPTPDIPIEQMRDGFQAIAKALGVEDLVRYAVDDARHWAACGDTVVSYDSNMAIEALLVDVPAINLTSDFGCIAGGGYGASDGVIVLEPSELAQVLGALCRDEGFRSEVAAVAATRKGFFNFGNDDKAANRVAELIEQLSKKFTDRPDVYVWQQYLDVESMDVTAGYHTTGRRDLVNMFRNRPKLLLDIGCAGGGNGALVKERFPLCQVWGIETNKAAANLASQRLDKVLVGMFEDFDLEAEGMAKGSLDGVILADVLEHMYNPWKVMTSLRDYLSAHAQVLISIPNVRNLVLIDDQVKGNWTYAREGLLDITHIRFFTEKEILRFCRETGYKVVQKLRAMDGRLLPLFEKARDSLPCNIETDRMIIKNVSLDEMEEMCALQFYLLLEKA